MLALGGQIGTADDRSARNHHIQGARALSERWFCRCYASARLLPLGPHLASWPHAYSVMCCCSMNLLYEYEYVLSVHVDDIDDCV